MGIDNNNPVFDTRFYEREFLYGTIEAMTANIIADNLLSYIDQ